MTDNEAKNFHVNTDMFGQYAKIPTGRSGDLHIYKIITRFHSNWYCDVPIIGLGDSTLHEEVTDVLNVIHCGVDESKVIRVALKDCEIIENEGTKELRKYRKIGTVEECREAVEGQKGMQVNGMNDDLIRRKAVIEVVDRHTKEDGTLDDDISVILEEVETAFDKEKVIEELEYDKEMSAKYSTGLREQGHIEAFDEAISIVKKGGINNILL